MQYRHPSRGSQLLLCFAIIWEIYTHVPCSYLNSPQRLWMKARIVQCLCYKGPMIMSLYSTFTISDANGIPSHLHQGPLVDIHYLSSVQGHLQRKHSEPSIELSPMAWRYLRQPRRLAPVPMWSNQPWCAVKYALNHELESLVSNNQGCRWCT